MNAAEIESETRRWFAYASSDLQAAQSLMEEPVPYSRQACFLAQQAAEKALKAALIFVDVRVPRTHDLDRVRNLLPAGWRPKLEPLDLPSCRFGQPRLVIRAIRRSRKRTTPTQPWHWRVRSSVLSATN